MAYTKRISSWFGQNNYFAYHLRSSVTLQDERYCRVRLYRMVDFVSFLKSQDWLRVVPGRTWPPPSTATTIVERLFSEQTCFFSCVGNLIHHHCTFEFSIGCNDMDYTFDNSMLNKSDESSVSRHVRNNIERGGRMESHVTNEILCSFAIVKQNNNSYNQTTSNGDYISDDHVNIKENKHANKSNITTKRQSVGLYAYFQGTVCLVDHTKITQLGFKENSLCIDLKHYVHLEIVFSKSQSKNLSLSIYHMLLESLSSKRFVPIEGWYERSVPSASSPSASQTSNAQSSSMQYHTSNNVVNSTISSTSSSIIDTTTSNKCTLGNNNPTVTNRNDDADQTRIGIAVEDNKNVDDGGVSQNMASKIDQNSNNNNVDSNNMKSSRKEKKIHNDDMNEERHYQKFLHMLNCINNVPCPYHVNWNECRNNNNVSMSDDTQIIDLYEKQMSQLIIRAGNSFCKYKMALKNRKMAEKLQQDDIEF